VWESLQVLFPVAIVDALNLHRALGVLHKCHPGKSFAQMCAMQRTLTEQLVS
jgi:hypothetical protein